MKEQTLDLLNDMTFSHFLEAAVDQLNLKWEESSDNYKLKISMSDTASELLEEKQLLLTQMLLKVEKDTGATPEAIKEALVHYSAFFVAHSIFFNGLTELAETL